MQITNHLIARPLSGSPNCASVFYLNTFIGSCLTFFLVKALLLLYVVDLVNNFTFLVQPWGERIPVGKDNLILRECILKNTDYVEGLVVYAGLY